MTLVLTPLLTVLGPFAVLLLAGVVFAETGLLVGFFLPGDSLLFAAGLFAAAGAIPVPVLVLGAAAWGAGVAGDQVAYAIGHRWGPGLVARGGGRRRWLDVRHLDAAQRFFERHGPKAIVLARFLPLVRTFTPVVAGAASMPRRRFTTYNVLGGLLWVAVMMAAGWFLGGVPWIAAHVELATMALIAGPLVLPACPPRALRRVRPGQGGAGPTDPGGQTMTTDVWLAGMGLLATAGLLLLSGHLLSATRSPVGWLLVGASAGPALLWGGEHRGRDGALGMLLLSVLVSWAAVRGGAR